MYSINFPDMFTTARTYLLKDKEATISNLKLLLKSVEQSLFGDPGFGCRIRNFMFEQNNIILHDLVIDDIYVAIQKFMPQIYIKRDDIKIFSEGVRIYATINCINKIDNTTNLFEIDLLNNE